MPLQLTTFHYDHPNQGKKNKELFQQWLETNGVYICFYEMDRTEYSYFDDRFYNLAEFVEEVLHTAIPIHATVDEAFEHADQLNKKVIMLFSVGTSISGYDFFTTLSQYNGYTVVGHIVEKLWYEPETFYQLHPQCVIADLDDWRSHGKISFGDRIQPGDILSGVSASKKVVYDTDPNVHLPLWISHNPDPTSTRVAKRSYGFGSKILNEYISSGLSLAAFNKESRKEKKFLGSDVEAINDHMLRHKKRVFSQPLDKMFDEYQFYNKSNKGPIGFDSINTIVSVALPINIVHKAIVFDHLTNFIVIDWSEPQLNFCRDIIDNWDGSTEHYNKLSQEILNNENNYVVPLSQEACVNALDKIRKSVKYSIENVFEFTADVPALYSISNCIDYEPTAWLFNRKERQNLISTMLNEREFILTANQVIYH